MLSGICHERSEWSQGKGKGNKGASMTIVLRIYGGDAGSGCTLRRNGFGGQGPQTGKRGER